MSYSKLQKEVSAILPKDYDGRKDGLTGYYDVVKAIIASWIDEKRYRDLISCAHGGWFTDDILLHPLANHLADQQEIIYIRFLCERKIRSEIRSIINLKKYAKDYKPDYTLQDILSVDLVKYASTQHYNPLAELEKWRQRTLTQMEWYISILERLPQDDYFHSIIRLKDRVATLDVKTVDLKLIQTKL